MNHREFSFQTKVWLYHGSGAWHFVTLPIEESDIIKELYGGYGRRGFGAIRVNVTIGRTTWQTSIFPDSKAGAYILPIKSEVRRAEGIVNNDTVQILLSLLV